MATKVIKMALLLPMLVKMVTEVVKIMILTVIMALLLSIDADGWWLSW